MIENIKVRTGDLQNLYLDCTHDRCRFNKPVILACAGKHAGEGLDINLFIEAAEDHIKNFHS